MLKPLTKDIARYQAGEISREDLAIKIVAENPAIEIAYAYIDGLRKRMDSPAAPRITITEQQFRAYFKIKGQTTDGTLERRGRPKRGAQPKE